MTSPAVVLTPTVGSRLRNNRRGIALGVLAFLVLAAITYLGMTGAGTTPLDPRSPKKSGAKALAQVLGQQGVTVDIVDRAAAFQAAQVDLDTTVVVSNVGELSAKAAKAVFERAPSTGATVVLGLNPWVEQNIGVSSYGTPVKGTIAADCSDPIAQGLHMSTPSAIPINAEGCFRDGSALLAAPVNGVRVLSADQIASNERITDGDNAAIMLRLLGQHPRLVWYVASPLDLPAGDGSPLRGLIPRWFKPMLYLLAIAVVAFLLWRGRRFGPLTAEDVPVDVKAIETTLARGRLYFRTHDRDHAGARLRAGTRRRLAAVYGLPRRADAAAIVDAVVAAGTTLPDGWTTETVAVVLTDGGVPDDAALTRLGSDLELLESTVRETGIR